MAMAMAIASSSWVVSHGSLDSCVTLVFLDPLTHEPLDIPSSSSTTEKLILVPPPDPVPCEITVKFQRRLCHVQNFYILSTARICELYSQANVETDSEYICTVKGWLPEDAEAFQSSETESQGYIHEVNKAWSSNKKTGIDNCVNIEDDLERLGSSSGEDSWVELKFNGSLNSETKFEAETFSTHNGTDNHELYCSINPVDLKKSGENHSPCVERNTSLSSKQQMYEAELELVDQSAWEAITIRLLSLQDRSQVEVDQVVILAVSGSEIPKIVPSTQSAGKGPNSEMLSMFLPSMLQMAQRVSRARFSVDPLKSGASNQLPEQGLNMLEKSVDSSCKDEVEGQAGPHIGIESYAAEAQNKELCQSKVEETKLRNACEPSQSSVHAVDRHHQQPYSSDCVDESLSRNMLLTLETFSKRFDRLETLCLHMESYLQSAFEKIDQRITLLEARQGKAFKRTSSFDLSHSGERHGESSPDVQFGTYHQKIAHKSPGEEPCPNLKVESLVLPEYKDTGSVPLAGHASAAVTAERHGDPFANTSTTDGYHEQTLLTRQAAESCPSSTVRSDIFPGHGFKDDGLLTFAETIEKGKGSNLTSASDDSAKEAASYSTSVPTKKLYGSLDDAWMTALTAFTSCYSQDEEDSNNLTCMSNDGQSDGTAESRIKHSEIENINHVNVSCKIEVESEEYDIGLKVKSDYDSSYQCSFDLVQLKQSSENESNINDDVEWKQPLINYKLIDSGSRSGGSLNDSVYGLPETQVSNKHMRQEITDSKLEYRPGNLVFSSLNGDVSLNTYNKLRTFGSVGCSSVGDIQFCSSQVKSGPSLLNQSSLDIETIDDYAIDSGKDSEIIPSGDIDPNNQHWLVNDIDDMSSCFQLNASCEETSNMSICNDKNVLICQSRFSCPAEVEPDRTPFIIGTSHSCSVAQVPSSQPGSAIEESTTIPYLLERHSLSNTGDEYIFQDVIDNCTKETNQYEKSLKNTQSSDDFNADAGSCGNMEFPVKVHNLIDDRMVNCDAIADLSFESTSSRLMIDIDNNNIVNLLLHKSLLAEPELDVSPEVLNHNSFKKDSGDVYWFSVETAFEAERALIDLEKSNTNETCNVLIDLLESDSNNNSLEGFSERVIKEEHHSLSHSVEELNLGYTTVFPGFENLMT